MGIALVGGVALTAVLAFIGFAKVRETRRDVVALLDAMRASPDAELVHRGGLLKAPRVRIYDVELEPRRKLGDDRALQWDVQARGFFVDAALQIERQKGGVQDVEVSDAWFDERIRLGTNDETRAREIFSDPVARDAVVGLFDLGAAGVWIATNGDLRARFALDRVVFYEAEPIARAIVNLRDVLPARKQLGRGLEALAASSASGAPVSVPLDVT